MKKKNLIILLLIPFLIALLGVVTINTTFSFIDNDIIGIDWKYNDMEAFKLTDKLYDLTAVGVNEKNYPAGAGNGLTWSVRNQDVNDENVYAEIVKSGNNYYLKTLGLGRIVVTCSNEKGNVFRSMNVVIYDTGVVLIQSKHASSQANIDQTQYYGEYDLKNGKKVPAEIEYSITAIPETMTNLLTVESKSDNVMFDINTKKLTITAPGKAHFTVGCNNPEIIPSTTYNFTVVEDGVNVYTYDDLLNCTNRSTNGEVVVLQKSFESIDNAYQINSNGEIMMSGSEPVLKNKNTAVFGNYNVKSKTFNFDNEVYSFKTTYSTRFIDSWNEHMKKIGSNNTITNQVIAGLRVQKSFYGNGYTINLHNLTFPSGDPLPVTDSSTGQTIYVPQINPEVDLFKGPLPFYTLGNHNNMPLVEALGQDNIGMYVDGDNIIINDVNLKNCDFGNMLVNLNTTGTVLETHGNNIQITNSRISNGKNVVRSFSSMNVTIDNCMISNARNFLVSLGSNEYVNVDGKKEHTLNSNKTSIDSFLNKDSLGDKMLNSFIYGSYDNSTEMKNELLELQNALNYSANLLEYKGSMTINDCLFYRSGISAIAFDSMFNGPFLYNSMPSSIAELLSTFTTQDGKPLAEFLAQNVGGISYPVELNIDGNTKFYDYKTKEGLDISGLINQNITSLAISMFPEYGNQVTIDKIFPIKVYLFNKASVSGNIYLSDGESYINVPIAYYGGGLNLSKVNINSQICKENFSNEINIDFLDNYINLEGESGEIGNMSVNALRNMMLKCVTVVTGYEPFKFICIKGNGYLYGDNPKVADLIKNAQGE